MTHLVRYVFAVIATGIFGSIAAAAITETANPIRDWMHAIPYPSLGLERAARSFPNLFVLVTISVGVLGLISLAILRRRATTAPQHLIATLAVLAFVGTAAYELIFGIPGGSGNWQASNAAGLTLADGNVTLLGWMSTFKRGFVAASFAGLLGAVFFALALPSHRDRASATPLQTP